MPSTFAEERGVHVNAVRKLQARLEANGYQVSMYLLAPGTTFGEHCLPEARIEAIFAGQLRLVFGGNTHLLGPGDWLEVPAGITIVTEVVGDEPVLGLDAAREPHAEISRGARPATGVPRRARAAAGSRRRSRSS
jgi:quercetin dioxygenase-like cupin family protein